MLSHTEENYLKEIFGLEEGLQRDVSTNAIAERLNTKASSVTDMLQKLSSKGLVVYKKYKGVHLSEKGRKKAVLIVRKHRLWETFLVQKLEFPWDEVHNIAEQLEHIQSEQLTSRLEAFLGYPKFDPHGHPIPDGDGEMIQLNSKSLAELKVREAGILIGVEDSSDDLLKYLSKNNIAIGHRLTVLEIEPFDNSITIENNSRQLVITEQVARNLYLKGL